MFSMYSETKDVYSVYNRWKGIVHSTQTSRPKQKHYEKYNIAPLKGIEPLMFSYFAF